PTPLFIILSSHTGYIMRLYLFAQLPTAAEGDRRMRARWYVFLGLVALLVITTTGLTQPPSGGRGGSDGSRGGEKGGFDRSSRGGFGDKGGFGGDRSSRGPGGPGGFSRDPAEMFDRMANGKSVWLRSESEPGRERFFDMIAGQLGVT